MAFFGRFTERAQKALIYAQEEARGLGHNYVGTEHLLLGLLRRWRSCCPGIKEHGIDNEKVREHVEKLVGKGASTY